MNSMRSLLSKIKGFFNEKEYNILIVDDVKENVELLYNYLLDPKIKVYKFTDPFECEYTLEKVDLSLIILDIQMPGMDGYELSTNIKNGKYGEINMNKPIIFVTGKYDDTNSILKGYNLGSIDYILKPVDYDDFVKKIEKYLAMDNNKILDIRMDNIKESI